MFTLFYYLFTYYTIENNKLVKTNLSISKFLNDRASNFKIYLKKK